MFLHSYVMVFYYKATTHSHAFCLHFNMSFFYKLSYLVPFSNCDNVSFIFNQSAQKIFGGEVKNHILLFVKKDGGEDTIEQFRAAASNFKGKVLALYIGSLTG